MKSVNTKVFKHNLVHQSSHRNSDVFIFYKILILCSLYYDKLILMTRLLIIPTVKF